MIRSAGHAAAMNPFLPAPPPHKAQRIERSPRECVRIDGYRLFISGDNETRRCGDLPRSRSASA